jgi:hypothetical protein
MNDMIHFMASHDLIDSLIVALIAFHHCLSPSVPSHLLVLTASTVHCTRASSLPFTLATWSFVAKPLAVPGHFPGSLAQVGMAAIYWKFWVYTRNSGLIGFFERVRCLVWEWNFHIPAPKIM